MITSKENIENVFSIFHDGTIAEFNAQSFGLRLRIECRYLSERINDEFEWFYVDLFDLDKFEFKPWSEDGLSTKSFDDLNIISQWEYNIFKCNLNEGHYQIEVEIENPKTALSGGEINFKCRGIKIYDQSLTEMSFSQLFELNRQYRTDFKRKK